MGDITLLSPVAPYQMPKGMWKAMSGIAARIAAEVVRHRNPADLLTEIYVAGIHHGAALASKSNERQRDIIDVSENGKRK